MTPTTDKALDVARSILGAEEAMQKSLERHADAQAMNRTQIRQAIIGGRKLRGRRASQGRIHDRGNVKALSKRRAKNAVAKQTRKENRA